MSEELLVRAGWLVTSADDDVLTDGAVLVRGAHIVGVGAYATLHERHPRATVLGSSDDALLPGLVNAHHHSHGASHIQQGVDDDVLEPWLLAIGRMRRVAPRLAVLLSAARQLRAGVTACVDVVSAGGEAESFAGLVDEMLAAYRESGMRAAVAPGVTERAFLVHGEGEDQRFLASLPAEDRALAASLLDGRGRLDCDDYLALMEERMRAEPAASRVRLWFGPPGPNWVHERTLQRIAELAEGLDTRIQTHCDESLYEHLNGPRNLGVDNITRLAELGVLGPRLSLAHGVWLTRAGIELLAGSGTALSHNPGSNLRLRAGIAPLAALLEAGVTVALGMDGTTLDDEEDGYAELRLAIRLAAAPEIDAAAPTARDLLRVATEGGATLLGRGTELGRIEAGRRAELVLLDTRRLRYPWLAPEADPLEVLLLRARSQDVHTVLVDGEVVLAEGRPTRFDETEVAEELAARAAAAPFPADAIHAWRQLAPRLRNWYRSWPVPESEPWIRYNARH